MGLEQLFGLSCCSSETFLLVVVSPRPLLAVSQCHHLLQGSWQHPCIPEWHR